METYPPAICPYQSSFTCRLPVHGVPLCLFCALNPSDIQMIEECGLAALMTLCSTLPVYYCVRSGASFAVLYLSSLIALCDGISAPV